MNTIEMMTTDIIQCRICGWVSDNYQGVCEYAARTCYHKEADAGEDTWKRYLHARVKSGHESVIEHNSMAFMFQVAPEMKNILMELVAYVAKNNNLLRTTFNTNGNSVIISGNIRMFRDFLKKASDRIATDKLVYGLAEVWFCYLYSAFAFLVNDDFIEDVDGMRTNIFTEGLSFNSRPFKWTADHATGEQPVVVTEEIMDEVYSENKCKLQIISNSSMDDLTSLVFDQWGFDVYDVSTTAAWGDAIKNMGYVTYKVTIPRIISQQDTRHRIGAISQQSQRYVRASNAEFYFPPYIEDPETTQELSFSYNEAMSGYEVLLNRNLKKEAARFVLPGGIMTTYVMTKPWYTLEHYFKERTSPAAQVELRNIALALRGYCTSHGII